MSRELGVRVGQPKGTLAQRKICQRFNYTVIAPPPLAQTPPCPPQKGCVCESPSQWSLTVPPMSRKRVVRRAVVVARNWTIEQPKGGKGKLDGLCTCNISPAWRDTRLQCSLIGCLTVRLRVFPTHRQGTVLYINRNAFQATEGTSFDRVLWLLFGPAGGGGVRDANDVIDKTEPFGISDQTT